LRELDAKCVADQVTRAELARRSRAPAQTVRRLLTAEVSNPTLGRVLDMLRSLDLGLLVVPLSDQTAEKDRVKGWLAHYGAAFYGPEVDPAEVPPPETALAEGLSLARESASVSRALPLAFWKTRQRLNYTRLVEEGKRLGRVRELGFFLDLTTKLSGDPAFEAVAAKLRVRRLQRPVQFFQPTTKRERKLAEMRTPEVARKWGFRMNMEMESFESMFEKDAEVEVAR
jgi:hypothetical protein